MKIYVYSVIGAGYQLGGTMTVVAPNATEAVVLVTQKLLENELYKKYGVDSLTLLTEADAQVPGVVHFEEDLC